MKTPPKRKLILFAAVAAPPLLLGLLLAGAWTLRAPIGVWVVTRTLRRAGVPAVVHIEALSSHGFRGSVVAGPAADPDLVIDQIEAEYALFPDRRFAPQIRAVRLSGVRLKARFDGHGWHFGSLQPLIDRALAAPPASAAGPRIQFDRAQVRLSTPAGAAVVTGQGLIDNGRLLRLAAALSAPRLAQGQVAANGVTGAVTATGGSRLQLRLTLGAADAHIGAAQAQAPAIQGLIDLPYGRVAARATNGPVLLGASLQAAALSGDGWTGSAVAGRLDMSGDLSGGVASPAYAGRLSLALQAQSARGGGARLDRATLVVASEALRAALRSDGPAASAPLTLRAAAAGGEAKVAGRRLMLSQLQASARGPVAAGRDGVTADLTLAAAGQGRFSAADAAVLAGQAAPDSAFGPANLGLRQALGDLRLTAPAVKLAVDAGAITVRLPQPVRLGAPAATLSLSALPAAPLVSLAGAAASGAAVLSLAGPSLPQATLTVPRYRLGVGGAEAQGRLALKGDLAPIAGLNTAMTLRLSARAAATELRLIDCAPAEVARVGADAQPMLREISVRLCPANQPLLRLSRRGYALRLRALDTAAALPGAEARLAGAALGLSLAGTARGGPTGALEAAGARVTDTADVPRFGPLLVDGRLALAQGRVQGAVEAALQARPQQKARAVLVHDLAAGTGQATLDPLTLTFASGGLQPADLTPAASAHVSQAVGAVEAGASLSWGPSGLQAKARLSTAGLDLNAAGGRLTGLSGVLDLPALTPAVTTGPDQHLTAARFETVVPLTDLDLRFALDGQALRIASARATLAHGEVRLEPLALPLAPGGTVSSVAHAQGVDLGEVLSGLNLADSVEIQAKVEARLPFSLTPDGLRFANGRIAATGPGRLSIKRSALAGVASGGQAVAQATAPGAPAPPPVPATNAVQDFAYQALENLAFDALDATVDSRPQGRLGVVFHVKGRNDPPKDLPARISLFDLARGRAFDEPIPLPKGTPVDLTLDTSLNFDELMAAYGQAGRSGPVQP